MKIKAAIVIVAGSLVFGSAAYAGEKKKATHAPTYSYNKRTKTWTTKAKKLETTSERIEKLRRQTWRKRQR